MPTFRFNVISVSALAASSQILILFVGNSCLLQDKSSLKMIGKVEIWQGLYFLSPDSLLIKKNHDSIKPVALNTAICNDFWHCTHSIWHDRLGHSSVKHLNALKNVLPLTSNKNESSQPCFVYPLAKQCRLSYYSNKRISAGPFELVHCDTWGTISNTNIF